MRILMLAFGSRGDVQPYVALGKGLQRAGFTVTLAAGRNFQSWIEREGLRCMPFRIDIEAYMQSDLGKDWLGNSSDNAQRELQNMRRMVDTIAVDVVDDLLNMVADADVLVSGLLTVEVVAAIGQARGVRPLLAMMSPLAPTASGAAGMQALLPRQTNPLNRWWGYVIETMLFSALKPASVLMHQKLGLPPVQTREFIRAANRTPTLLGISPLVVPHPSDWGAHHHVTGYWFLDAPPDWQPSPALQAFLDAGAPPVYIGFGSMSNRDPQATTRVMIDALKATGQRGVIHSGWAGLHAEDLPDDICLLDFAPHDWLFPRMAAVIHHGGSGTTGAALRAGVPSAIVAHIGDQPFFGRRVYELGVGAPPIKRHDLTAERLAATIHALTGDAALRSRAAALGERIRAEDGVGNAVRVVERLLR